MLDANVSRCGVPNPTQPPTPISLSPLLLGIPASHPRQRGPLQSLPARRSAGGWQWGGAGGEGSYHALRVLLSVCVIISVLGVDLLPHLNLDLTTVYFPLCACVLICVCIFVCVSSLCPRTCMKSIPAYIYSDIYPTCTFRRAVECELERACFKK